MAAHVEAMRHLAKSVLSCVLLSLCSIGSGSQALIGEGDSESVTGAVQWASVVTLLSAVYYLQFQVWRRIWQRKKDRRVSMRSQYRQTRTAGSADPSSNSSNSEDVSVDLDSLPPSIDSEEAWVEGVNVVSNNLYYPELTMSSVWTYVYGWGILLFVCLYCLAGANVPSSCWWVMGMIALSFDELISKGLGKWWVCLVGLSLCGSVFAVWSGTLIDNKGNFIGDLTFAKSGNIPLINFVLGVVFPVSTPFIFFTIRSTVRNVNRDVSKLCEFALPFMTVLAVCYLVATSGVCATVESEWSSKAPVRGLSKMDFNHDEGQRRGLDKLESFHKNTTDAKAMVETVAKFAGSYMTNLSGSNSSVSLNSNVMQFTLILISPLAAFWLIRVLIVSILTGHSTEFITAFILVTSARFGMTHSMGIWSLMAVSGAGSAFLLLLFIRRT
jgi:hypothetical protein